MVRPVGYKRTYKMRQTAKGRKYISIGLPWELVEREAYVRGLAMDRFIKEFVVEVEYSHNGIQCRFKKSEKKVSKQ